ncbi:MAG: family 10 glycosylhydrolase [Muribaculaceae bacterium]|nr:family 10 glycosylhydrolase [Muribaculaceae bacterium]
MKFNKIFKTMLVALGATSIISLTGCSDDDCPNYWDDFYGAPETTPSVPSEKPAYIWVDAAANFPSVANSKEGIARYVKQAKDAGFTDLLVDVRPTNGDVLFKTDLVDQVTTLYTWQRIVEEKTSRFLPTTRTESWDYLQAWIDAAHAEGLRVHAALNTMLGGNYINNGMIAPVGYGMVFRDPSKRDMVNTINYTDPETGEKKLVNQMDLTTGGERFFNPHHPEVQKLILGLVEDVAKYQDLDGIVLDRGRFKDCTTDFSDLTRGLFEEYIGTKLTNWPDDVMPLGASEVPTSNFPKYYKEWWTFRAQTMHDLVEACAAKAHETHPGISFGCYVGAWYGSYYQNGVNWASPEYDVRTVSSGASVWCNGKYIATGYADHVDLLILGCYAKPNTVFGTADWTSQGFAINGMLRVKGATTVVGGTDFGNYPTENHDYLDSTLPDWNKVDFLRAAYDVVGACRDAMDGFFLFDICHLQGSPEYWTSVTKALHNQPFSDDDTTEEGAAE